MPENNKGEAVAKVGRIKKQPKSQLTEKQIIDALKAKGGFVSTASRALGVSTQALYKRINSNAKIKDALEEIRESHLDMAEMALLAKIKEKDLGAICFYLKCIGKKRGYIEKQQVDLTQSEGPLVIVKEAE
jgi:hypothetical protein